MNLLKSLLVSAGLVAFAFSPAIAQDAGMKKWVKGKGWGWVWGQQDEVGALNEMTDASRLAALRLVKQGKAYDLGLAYDRMSYKWPGHSPGEVISFRTPAGVKTQQDLPFTTPEGGNTGGTAWHSSALFMNDNVATQIDGLGHITHGQDNHFYNGFKAAEWGGDFGLRKADVTTIPPIIARGVLIDVAGYKKRRCPAVALRDHRRGSRGRAEGPERRCYARHRSCWSAPERRATGAQNGSDHAKIGEHDSAGIGLKAAKWLVEQKGALVVGTDTSGLEYVPPKPEDFEGHGRQLQPGPRVSAR